MRSPARLVLTAAASLVLVTAGCSDDPNSVGEQAKQGGQQGYVAGNGAIEQLAADRRDVPVDLRGQLLDGSDWDSSSVRGQIVVVNVWGSWCPPCIEELDDLAAAYDTYEGSATKDRVTFIGINYRESADTGAAFARSRDIPYPSLTDQDGKTLLALQGKVIATPTTLVLDGEGRIAARVSGPVTTGTLTALVDDLLAEGA